MRPSTLRTFAELLLMCRRCAKSRQEHAGTGDVYDSLFDFVTA